MFGARQSPQDPHLLSQLVRDNHAFGDVETQLALEVVIANHHLMRPNVPNTKTCIRWVWLKANWMDDNRWHGMSLIASRQPRDGLRLRRVGRVLDGGREERRIGALVARGARLHAL